MKHGLFDHARDDYVPCAGATLSRDSQLIYVNWTFGGAHWSCPTSWCRQAVAEQLPDTGDVRLSLSFFPPPLSGVDIGHIVVRLVVRQPEASAAMEFAHILKRELGLRDEELDEPDEDAEDPDDEPEEGMDGVPDLREPPEEAGSAAGTIRSTAAGPWPGAAVAPPDAWSEWIVFRAGPEDQELLAEVRRRTRTP